MRRFLLFFGPVILGILVFSTSLFFYTKSTSGNGALQVTSVPISFAYLNGKPLGKTPLCKCEGKERIPAGEYTLKLVPTVGDNLLPYEERVVISKGVLTVVDRNFGPGGFSSGSVITLVPLPDKTKVGLFVASFPSGASIAIDGNPAGTTPFTAQNLTSSDHDLLLTKDGYQDKTVHVHTIAGYQLTSVVTLSVLAPDATQSANFQLTTPTPIAKTKVTILDTPTGFLRVRSEPTLGASETAQVKPGQTFDYLDENDGWYQIRLTDGTSGWVSTQYAKKN